jgi:hypothetical protein
VANLLGHHDGRRNSHAPHCLRRRTPQGGQVAKVSRAVASRGMVAKLLGHHGTRRNDHVPWSLRRRTPHGGQVAKVSRAVAIREEGCQRTADAARISKDPGERSGVSRRAARREPDSAAPMSKGRYNSVKIRKTLPWT